ncbi:agmatinase [Anaerosporobacter sp.]|uniref:agmatinase n=1 Tax=Anaerosporobacter sp. TaxID=1872529 RepID=UPI00286F32BA|nr:agmatinase [Anaerosporobacter sp.]
MWNEEIPSSIRKQIENEKNTLCVTPFGGLPLKKEFDGEDYCIVGIPYDTSTTRRAGCRFGPRVIRTMAPRINNKTGGGYSQDAHYMMDNLKGMDYGDLAVRKGYTEITFQLIYEGMKEILDNNVIPIVLGGDHIITYPELKAYSEKCGKPVAMIHFDSHNDTSDTPEERFYTHGSPFRRAIEDGFLDAAHSIQIGIRGYVDSHRLLYAEENGMEVITARELHKIGIEECVKRIRARIGDAPCIVTFDVDFLDPTVAPGTGTPVAGGFSAYEGYEIIRQALPGLDVKGFDIVEVTEDYDPAQITGLFAGYLVTQFLVAVSKNKKAKEEK